MRKILVQNNKAIFDAAKKEQEQGEKEYKEEQSTKKESAKEEDECDKLSRNYYDKISTIEIALSKPTLTERQYNKVKNIIDNLKGEIISCSNKGYNFDLNKLYQYDIDVDNKFNKSNNTTSSSSNQKESYASNDSSNEKESPASNSGDLNLDDLPPACTGFTVSYKEYEKNKRYLIILLNNNDNIKDKKREQQMKTTLGHLARLKVNAVRGTEQEVLNNDTKKMETCSENRDWYMKNRQWFINEFENIARLSHKYENVTNPKNKSAFILSDYREDYSVPEQKKLTETEFNEIIKSVKSGGKTKKSRRKRKSNISKKMRKKTKTIYKRKKMLVQTKRKK